MKLNKKSLRFAVSMAAIFAVLAVCARVTDHALPAAAEVSDKPVIVLDAGHGGLDSGAVGKGGTLEKDDVTQLDVLTGLTGVPAPAPLAALAGKTPRFDRVVDKADILSTVALLKDL